MTRNVLIASALLLPLLSATSQAATLVDQVAAVCVKMGATPVHIAEEDAPEYCACEAAIWAKRGTQADMRATMTYMTGNKRYMKGAPYSSDAALDFIVAHSGAVDQACAG